MNEVYTDPNDTTVEYYHRSEWFYGRHVPRSGEKGTFLWLSPAFTTREQAQESKELMERDNHLRYKLYRRTTVTTLVED